MAEVAVLGMGRMGAAMARSLARAGHQVHVWNRTRAAAEAVAGAAPAGSVVVADSPADAVSECDVVLSMLADGEATRSVLLADAVLRSCRAGAVVCDLGTSGVHTARELADALATQGVRFVDAPVSGSVPAVESGTLLVMASGDPAALEDVRPVLESFARLVLRVGDVGAGQVMKLAVNLVVHDLNAALSEALVLAERAGVAREDAYGVLQESVVASPFVQYKRPAFLDPATPVAMSLDLVRKDLRLITAYADEVGSPREVTQAALDRVAAACDAGMGGEDMAALSRFTETQTT
jgi:3-hydroxyisobutyrate dehydrogenase